MPVLSLITRSQPNYEEWKLDSVDVDIIATTGSQPNYEEWKPEFSDFVQDANIRSQPNYEEWKPRNRKLSYLRTILFTA